MTKLYQNCKNFLNLYQRVYKHTTPPPQKYYERDSERKEKEKQARKKEFIAPKIKIITELYGVLRDNTFSVV